MSSSRPWFARPEDWQCSYCKNFSRPERDSCHICCRSKPGNQVARRETVAPKATKEAEPYRSTCVICRENPSKIAPIGCGHKCMCEDCYSPGQVDQCPICQADIYQIVRVIDC